MFIGQLIKETMDERNSFLQPSGFHLSEFDCTFFIDALAQVSYDELLHWLHRSDIAKPFFFELRKSLVSELVF